MVIDIFSAPLSGQAKEHLQTFTVRGIDEVATNDISLKNDSSKPKVTLSFELSRSGLLLLNKAEAKVEELVVVEEKPPVVKKLKTVKLTPNVTAAQPDVETEGEQNSTNDDSTTTGEQTKEESTPPTTNDNSTE